MHNKKIYILTVSLLLAGFVFMPVEAKKSSGSYSDANTAGVSGLEYEKYKNQCTFRTCIKLIKNIVSLQKSVEGLKKAKAEDDPELKSQEEEMYKFDKLFVDLAKGNITEEQAKALMDKPAQEDSSCPDEDLDQPDVPVSPQALLHSGDLVAWGIPSIPSIPRPASKSTSSSSSSTSAQSQPVNDAGYKAVRGMEQESEKVTDSEITQFLSDLSSRVTASK